MNGNRNMNGNTYKLKLPRLISDGMVLQRNAAARIWGWAAPLEKVTLVFVGKVYVTFAGMDSSWEVIMDEMEAGGPYRMEIRSGEPVFFST